MQSVSYLFLLEKDASVDIGRGSAVAIVDVVQAEVVVNAVGATLSAEGAIWLSLRNFPFAILTRPLPDRR